MKTGYECTLSIRGIDHQGTCDDTCGWWVGMCVAAKGCKYWDGKESSERKVSRDANKEGKNEKLLNH